MTALPIHAPNTIDQRHGLTLAHGGCDEGAPGPRLQYGEGFYAACFRNPEGNKLAFVHYGEVR